MDVWNVRCVIWGIFDNCCQSANPVEKTSAIQSSTCYVTHWHYMQRSTRAAHAWLYVNTVDASVHPRLCSHLVLIQHNSSHL